MTIASLAAAIGVAPDGGRIAAALAFALAYLGLCLAVAIGRRRRRTAGDRTPAGVADRMPVLVAFATQTGSAEAIARRTATALAAAGTPARLASLATLDAAALATAGRALFVVSTTGEGDGPDAADGFVRRVMGASAPLAGLRYGVLALGDRSYARFCAFGHALDGWLRRQGATPLFDAVEVDDGEAGALGRWSDHLGALGAAVEPIVGDAVPFGRWRLVERRLLNPGSDHPAYHIALAPLDGPAQWQAGDVARIALRNGPPVVLPAPWREYSIASLPGRGRIELLVRQVRHADGRLGMGSAWLTRDVALGDELPLRVRENRAFHGPDDDRPMILIGTGTGLAGLRAHLHARVAAGHCRNWLVFGERSAAQDWFRRDEIMAWRAGGALARLDVAFSRDQVPRIYVQHRLADRAEELRRWVDDGAAIYVCGGMVGMAPAVTDALRAALGETRLEALAAAGRYRRDVY